VLATGEGFDKYLRKVNCTWDLIKRGIQPESFKLFIEGPAFSQSYNLAPRPPLPPLCKYARPAIHRKTEKERQSAVGEGGKRVGETSVVLACAIVSFGALRKDVGFVETDLMVQDPGCLLAGVPDLHVIVQVLRQKSLHYHLW
jgi:hypothetical protein